MRIKIFIKLRLDKIMKQYVFNNTVNQQLIAIYRFLL